MTQSVASSTRTYARFAPLMAAVVLLGVIVSQTSVFAFDVLMGLARDGFFALLYTAAAVGWGVWWTRPVTRTGPRSLQCVAAAAGGLGVLGLIFLLLGLAGLLNAGSVWAVLAVGLISLGLWARRVKNLPAASADLWWLLPLAAWLGVALLAMAIVPGFLWKPLDPHPYDVLSYHLQVPREWFDAGRIIPLTHNAFSYFPMAMETHYLATMHLRGGPWAGMYLCVMITLVHGLLTAAAVFAGARTFGATRARSAMAAMIFLAVPWTLQLSSVAYVETGVMLYGTLAVVFAAWAIERGEKIIGRFALAGVFAGLACGMKYTAFAMTAAPVCGLGILFLFRSTATKRRAALSAAVLVLMTMIVASPWVIRNVAWTGNPVFPLATDVFGRAHFTADQVERYRVAHTPPADKQSPAARIETAFRESFLSAQFGYVALPIGTAAMLLCLRRKSLRFVAISALAMTLVWISATHVLPRFVTPVLPLMCVAIACCPLPTWTVALAGVAQGVLGLFITWRALSPMLDVGRLGLFYFNDVAAIQTEAVQAAVRSGQTIALVGDAQAFFYAVPSNRLMYRSVFDVAVPPGVSLTDGWLGESVDSLRRRGVWVVINASELRRLSATYRHLPAPLPPYDDVSEQTSALPPLR